jgi:hypothetical protein
VLKRLQLFLELGLRFTTLRLARPIVTLGSITPPAPRSIFARLTISFEGSPPARPPARWPALRFISLSGMTIGPAFVARLTFARRAFALPLAPGSIDVGRF